MTNGTNITNAYRYRYSANYYNGPKNPSSFTPSQSQKQFWRDHSLKKIYEELVTLRAGQPLPVLSEEAYYSTAKPFGLQKLLYSLEKKMWLLASKEEHT